MKSGLKKLDSHDPLWETIFTPRSIVVIGKTKRNRGAQMYIESLKRFQYKGDVYVVSTDGSGGYGFETFGSIGELPSGIDFAVLSVSARLVPDALRELKEKGIKVAHIFASGFGDRGDEKGKKLDQELKMVSGECNIRIIGPNCMGVYSPRIRLAYPPGVFPEKEGNIGFISHSGGTAQSFAWCGENYNYFHSKGISIGNSTDLAMEDFLEYMVDDPETEIIILYVEGIKDGERFINLIKRVCAEKPVIILKAGLSDAGVTAVASHTGILAGSSEVWGAAIRQAGGIQVETFDEMVETASAFDKMKGRPGKRIALINRGGGEGVIATDLLTGEGLDVPPYSEATQKTFSELLPSAGTGFKNPLDFAGVGGFPGLFEKLFDAIDKDENTDIIIYQHNIEFAHLFRKGYNDFFIDALISFYKASHKTLLVVLPLYYSFDVWIESFRKLTSMGISAHPSIVGAVKAARHLAEYSEIRERFK